MNKRYHRLYRIKKKKSILKNRFFWLIFFICFMTVVIFLLAFFLPCFQVAEIRIFGNQKVLTKDIQDIIEKEIKNQILFFDSKSLFLVNSNGIEKELFNNFPRLAKLKIKKIFPNIIMLEVEERKAIAIFFQGENQFFIDREGVIFEIDSAKEEEPEILKIATQNLKEEIKPGQEVIPKEKMTKILEIGSRLKENFQIFSSEILIISDQRLNVKTSEGWEIYFNLEGDISWQLTKLGAVLEKEIPPGRRENLEYIDLRFGNFAPYKYR